MEDLDDTTSSPSKQADGERNAQIGTKLGAKKRLDMNAGVEAVPPPPSAYISPSEKKKKLRRAAETVSERSERDSVYDDMAITTGLAASEEYHREQ
jgi:hypothetical protein